MTEELKPRPCPWCDEAPGMFPSGMKSEGMAIECQNPKCGVRPICSWAPPEKAIKAWNTRSPAWRDIESAPLEQRVMLYHPSFPAPANQMSVGIRYPDFRFWASDSLGCLDGDKHPTHWMPLPQPPEEGRG